jgi:hypothetical protein
MKLGNVRCECEANLALPPLEGELIMTNYKLIFKIASVQQQVQ